MAENCIFVSTMLLLSYLQCVVSPVCTAAIPKEFLFPRVFGGHTTGSGEFPWMVRISILVTGPFICAGSILNEEWIVTGSHCVYDLNPESLSIIIGDHDLTVYEGTEYYHRALQVIIHPEFSQDPIQNDIALIRVSPTISFNENIKDIRLPPPNFKDPETALFAGWGYTDESYKSISTILMKKMQPIISLEECKQKNLDGATRVNLNEDKICAGNDGGCKADSGGALIALKDNNIPVIYGIASYGTYCGDSEHPGIFTRVSSYLDFIYKHVSFAEPLIWQDTIKSVGTTMLSTYICTIIMVTFCFVYQMI